MKTAQQLHEAAVRRREAEHLKYQKSTAVNKYYDQWGKITTRFESWTTPQYYREAEEGHAKRLEEKKKIENLSKRRQKLKAQLNEENERYQNEMKEMTKPKPKSLSTQILERVKDRLNETEEQKKRIDMEAQLYQKWRHGVDRNSIILESRSPQQAMAKLSWMDRQVEMQVQNEMERKDNQERELRLQEEERKHEIFLLEKNKLRETEIKELRAIQDSNVQELKIREQESNDLKFMEIKLKTKKDEILKEIEQLKIYNERRRDRIVALHNLRRIKMLLRDRSESVRCDLKHDLDLLDRIAVDSFDDTDSIAYLRRKFQVQYDCEMEMQRTIEVMYESEAKHNLEKQENKWNDEALIREQQLKVLLDERLSDFEVKIIECIERQKDLICIRENHIKAIEGTNDRLRELMNDKSEERFLPPRPMTSHLTQTPTKFRPISARPASSSTFNSIFPNLDYDLNFNDLKLTDGRPGSCSTENSELSGIPRYGRKKIAWC